MSEPKQAAGQHTPGPWVAKPINSAQMTIRNERDTVATVYRHQGSPSTMDRAGEGDANARLIAAAPELLEALRECITDDNAHCLQHQETPSAMARRLRAINDVCRAAIAKAEGHS